MSELLPDGFMAMLFMPELFILSKFIGLSPKEVCFVALSPSGEGTTSSWLSTPKESNKDSPSSPIVSDGEPWLEAP